MTSSTSILSPALNLFDAQLELFAISPEFQSNMSLIFGENHESTALQTIFAEGRRTGVFNLIKIVPVGTLNGAYGGFSRDTNKIYLESGFINSATSTAIADVLLEEYGHYIDAQLNPVETLGDEGEIFADLVQGKSINPAAFTEDDTEIVNIDGNWITVEQAAGELDSSFGDENGFVRTLVKDFSSITVSGIKVQADGKIVIAGAAHTGKSNSGDFVVIRYNSDGTLDTTFADGYGILYTDVDDFDRAYGLALQPDGKIVVAGSTKLKSETVVAVVRFNSDGNLDTSFSRDGVVTTSFDGTNEEAKSVLVQSDGKILIAGTQYINSSSSNAFIILARYNSNGSLDVSFDGDGKVMTGSLSFYDTRSSNDEISMVLQPDHKILVGCTLSDYNLLNNNVSDFGIFRYNSDGSLDGSFGSNGDGMVRTNYSYPGQPVDSADSLETLAVQPDGKIVAVGSSGVDSNSLNLLLVRYNNNGTVDNSFGENGTVLTDVGNDVAYQGIDGLALQTNGKILVTAQLEDNTFVLIRYNHNGTLDTSFGNGDGIMPIPFNGNGDETLALQKDGKILVAGIEDEAYAVARFLGVPAPVFDPAQYGASYGDLITGIGYNLPALTNHYFSNGSLEGRQQDLFDEYRYIASNPDLIGAFGLNGTAATEHYIRNGFFEGRSLTGFIPSRYLLSQGDLLNFYGTDLEAASSHYITYGFGEGRDPNLFKSDRYIASHPDLIQAFHYNLEAGSNHYLFSGRSEGRQITFDPQAYLNRYGDVQQAFGNDLNAATAHYINNGFNEGRTWM